MNESQKPIVRRLATMLLIVAAVASGWYVGGKLGGDTPTNEATQRNSETEVYRDVAGRVVRLAPEHGSFTVDHEEIDGFMPAMVMDLQVSDTGELRGLSPDDEILFDLARIGDTYKAVRIRRANDDAEASNPSDPRSPSANPLGPGDLVPDLELFNASGERFRLREMEPRHKVITFFYARCPLQSFCPAQSEQLARLQRHINTSDRDIHLLSLSLDAEHDDPEVLAGYAQRFEADPSRWTLAGSDDADAVRDFANRAGAGVRAHDDSFEIDHALVALRVDGDRIVDRVYGLEAMERLIRGM